jgi:uncharacterized protein (TIGR02231 family)
MPKNNLYETGVFIVALIFVLPFCRGAAAFSVESVDFYPVGAKFTFRVEAGEPENEKSFAFTLPGAFDRDSLRCLTREKLTSLKIEESRVKETPSQELEPLRRKIEELQSAIRLLEVRKPSLDQALAMLQRDPFPTGGDGKEKEKNSSSGDPALWGDAWIAYIASAQKARLGLDMEMLELNETLSKTLEELEKAREDFETLQADLEEKKPHNASSLLRISGTAETGSPLLFEARTSAAGWSVEYEMDMASETGDIAVKMNAQVWQNTGLNADGELAFHTRQPFSSLSPPEVQPLTVTLRPAPGPTPVREDSGIPKSAHSRKATSSAALEAAYDERDMADEIFAAPSTPVSQTISTLADVTLLSRGKIESGRERNRFGLGQFQLKGSPVLIAVPGQRQEAWIVASLDSVPGALLPGAAELAVDGVGTGRATIPAFMAERVYLPFGTASRLTSKKEPFVGRTGNSWTGKGFLTDGYTLTVTNGLETEREVTVRDRVPIPATDKIALELVKIDPAPTERDRNNRLSWKINIKPGETRKITVEYALRYPGDASLGYSELK